MIHLSSSQLLTQVTASAVAAAVLSGVCPWLLHRRPRLQRLLHTLLLGLSGILGIAAGIATLLSGRVLTAQLPMGLPWQPWRLRFDSLAAFFFVLLGLVVTAVAVYGFSYLREYRNHPRRLTAIMLFTGLFVGGMQMVLVAADAFAFMVAWELMSLASYFLVATDHSEAETRRASFLYLLMAHVSGIAILLGFGVLAGFSGSFAFADMRAHPLDLTWSSIAFALALFGFGTKAGLLPMHGWLPRAHPIAPSHISALLSATIVKIALYGFIRVTFDLIGTVHWSWGAATLLVGAATALYGVLYAFVQTDLKRLLAYSTVENMGVIFMGMGLALIFFGTGHSRIGTLALIASLYHALNHACFKGLLFLGAGAVRHTVHGNDLNRMGGLIRLMPWTALLFLFGAMSIASLPPFNGFVSEWLLLQSALQATVLHSGVLRAAIPTAAAVLVLTAALSAASLVKAYGLSFLGRPRSHAAAGAHEVPVSMRLGQLSLAVLCLSLGVLPTPVVGLLEKVPQQLLGYALPSASRYGWLWLTPVSPQRASYSAPLVFAGIFAAVLTWLAVYLVLKKSRRSAPVPRVPPWDCGYGPLTARMQYSAESFSMPVQRIFQPLYDLQEDDGGGGGSYGIRVTDILERLVYQPVARGLAAVTQRVSALRTGHLHHYLLYSFATLIVLLWLIV